VYHLSLAYSLRIPDGVMATVQALVPPTSLLPKPGDVLQIPAPALLHSTPISPNFPSHGTTTPVPADVLRKWPETAAMLIPGPSVSECSAALLALGDCLLANHWVEAAHAWYVSLSSSLAMNNLPKPEL
jgi:COPII coat assembly protein SEC16